VVLSNEQCAEPAKGRGVGGNSRPDDHG